MNNKVIYVDFKKTSKKSKRYLKGNNLNRENLHPSYFNMFLNKVKSFFKCSKKKNYREKDNIIYKHWL